MPTKTTWKDIGAPEASALLSPAFVTTSNTPLVYTSGCVGTDPKTGELPEDLEQQTRNAIENLRIVLSKSGCSSLDQVVKVLLFVADGKYAPVVNKVYKEYFTNQPCRSCVVVGFPNEKIKVELECVAEIDKKTRWFKL